MKNWKGIGAVSVGMALIMTATLAAPVAAVAFAYLVAKRKKQKDAESSGEK